MTNTTLPAGAATPASASVPHATVTAATEAVKAAIVADAAKADSKVKAFAKKWGYTALALVLGFLAGHVL